MPLTLSQTRAELEKLGHNPRKSLGQNFLVDGNIVEKSLELAEVEAGDQIVEIGPGLGTLTRTLLDRGAHVWAVEFDQTIFNYLQTEVAAQYAGQFDLLLGDAVDHPRGPLPADLAKAGFKVVANLPYAVSTPWMAAILEHPLPDRMVLMLQRETADRFAAAPGTKQFGAISIWLQSAFEVLPGHRVPPGCFHPAPEVDSYLLNLKRKESPFHFPTEIRDLIRRLFQQRRKQIGSIARKIGDERLTAWIEGLPEFGASGHDRPEAIPLEAWQALAGDSN